MERGREKGKVIVCHFFASQVLVYSCQIYLKCVYIQFAFLVFCACTDLISTYFVSTVAEIGVQRLTTAK